MVRIDAKTYAHFVRLLRTEENKFLHLHTKSCILNNKNISPYQLYIELFFHLHTDFYYLPYLAKNLWEKLNKRRLEDFPNQWAARRQIKKAYLPVMIGIRKNKLRRLKKIVNQNVYEKALYVAMKAKDKQAIGYFNTLASELKLRVSPGKIPGENKSWRDYDRDSKIKIQENLENDLIFNNSQLSVVRDGRIVRPINDKGYGQFCAKCGKEFKSVIYKNNALFYKNDNDNIFSRIRIYRVKINPFRTSIYFVCSKNCYDALRISKKRKQLLQKQPLLYS